MKRLLTFLLIFCLMAGMLAGCISIEDEPLSNGNNTGSNNGNADNGNTDSSNKEKATIEDTVIYNENDIIITATGIDEDSFFGTEIKLRVENNTDKNIIVSCSNFIVNGFMMTGLMSIDVAAGKKANDSLTLYSSDLERAGITQPATIVSHDAQILDGDTYGNLFDISLNINTSIAATYTQQVDESGDVLFQQDGLTVIAKHMEDTLLGKSVYLLVKNETGKDITVSADNVSVNGYTVTVFMYDTVCTDTVCYSSLDLMTSDLEENEITDIEEVTFTLNILDPDTFQTILETDELKVVVSK